MRPLRRFARPAVALLLAAVVLAATGCPSKSQLDRAAEASNRLAGSTLTVVRAVRELYEQRVIDDAQKDKLAAVLQKITTGGQTFNTLVVVLSKQEAEGKLPSDSWQQIASTFAEVSTPLLGLLEDLRALPPAASSKIRVALIALQAAVLTIAQLVAPNVARVVEKALDESKKLARAAPALRPAV